MCAFIISVGRGRGCRELGSIDVGLNAPPTMHSMETPMGHRAPTDSPAQRRRFLLIWLVHMPLVATGGGAVHPEDVHLPKGLHHGGCEAQAGSGSAELHTPGSCLPHSCHGRPTRPASALPAEPAIAGTPQNGGVGFLVLFQVLPNHWRIGSRLRAVCVGNGGCGVEEG